MILKTKTIRLLFCLLLTCFISTFILANEPIDNTTTKSKNLYQAITKENVKTLWACNKDDDDEKDFEAEHKIFEEQGYAAFLKVQFEKLLNPNPDERRHSMLTLMSKFEKKNPLPQTNVLDQKTWSDLEILCGSKSNPRLYLASQLDRTVTEAGRVTFYRKLVNPLNDIKQLEDQQAIVKHLLNNESLFKELDERLQSLVESENLMLSFWFQKYFSNWHIEHNKTKLPFSSKITCIKNLEDWINKSPAFFQAQNIKGQFFSCMSHFLLFYWLAAVPTYALTSFDLASCLPKDVYESKWIPKAKDMSSFTVFSMFSLLGMASWIISKTCDENSDRETIGRVSKGGLELWNKSSEVYWTVRDFSDRNANDKYDYAKVVHFARYLNNLKAMRQLIAKDEMLAKKMQGLQAFDNYLDKLEQTSEDIKYLLELLEKETFNGNYSSWFIYWGRVKVAFALISELKNKFVGAMVALGELDACMSIAKLYKEFRDKRVTFCFPTYIDPLSVDTPSVKAVDFWNPFIKPEKVVPSSLSVGQPYEKPQNVIITGPNASGKSTITKAFVMTIIVAQSLGIAPAQELTLTPFNKIITYLNITDDIAAGNSHFMAGVLRAREITQTFDNLLPHQFALTAIDEVFNGTTFEEGRAAAYSLIKQLGADPLGMLITNTHFKLIPTLEQSTGHFMNYKVSVIERPGEKIHYPFKLERGISNQNVAFKILREEGFSDEFLEQAQQVLDECVT